LDLSPDALNRVVEAITDRTLIIPLLEIDGNSKIALLELKLPSIVDNGTIVVPAELIVLGAKFGCLQLSLRHRPHGGERDNLSFLSAARAEDDFLLTGFAGGTAVR
jgi:hypothetical protein